MTNYDELNLSGLFFASLDGDFVPLPVNCYLYYDGTNFDLFYNTGDYRMYYKDNGGGVWTVVACNSWNGSYTGTETWYAVLTAGDPTALTGDVNDYIPNVSSVSNDGFTAVSDQTPAGDYVPSELDSNVTYGVLPDPSTGTRVSGLSLSRTRLGL